MFDKQQVGSSNSLLTCVSEELLGKHIRPWPSPFPTNMLQCVNARINFVFFFLLSVRKMQKLQTYRKSFVELDLKFLFLHFPAALLGKIII